MKYLIIYSHPNKKSFNHAILETIIEVLKQKNVEFKIRDLYEMKFQPVLSAEDIVLQQSGKLAAEVEEEQKLLSWANHIIFIFPLWWSGFPAILKGYFDRVFTNGFAYQFTEKGVQGLLLNKKAIVFTTAGASESVEKNKEYEYALKKTLSDEIFKFCAISVQCHEIFYSVPYTTDKKRKTMLAKVQKIISELNT